MTFRERMLFLFLKWRAKLSDLHRKAWNGLSILVIQDDSALQPRRHRINYYVLLFFGLLLIAVPIVAMGLYVERRVRQQTDPEETIKNRLVLLRTQKLLTLEKTALLNRLDGQIQRYQQVTHDAREAGAQGRLLREYMNQRFAGLTADPRAEPYVDEVSRNIAEMRSLRARTTVLQEAGYFALNLAWHRISVYHIIPRIRPLPLGVGQITSEFGRRENPLAFGGIGAESGEFHGGIDIAASYGRPIIATAPGIVTQTSTKDTHSGYGRYVRLHHGLGYTTLYAHCSTVLVEKGQYVKRGQIIARVGRSGRTTGAHVHYEVRLGKAKPINPREFMDSSKR